LKNWTTDSTLVYEYLDRGEDLDGLKNNVRYYYRLLSFDEGAVKLKLDPMYSLPVEGVNSISIIPSTDPTNISAGEGEGTATGGTLGDIGSIRLIPRNTTNYNKLFGSRTLTMTIGASTDGVKYLLPITVRDSLSGRSQNAVIDPGLNVHGTAQTSGVKQGTGKIADLFNLGGADIEFTYHFEQLADSFKVRITREAPSGADVPIILYDSLKVTGILTITPYTNSEKEVVIEFTQGGIDTVSGILKRYVPYLTMTIKDGTGQPYTDSVSFTTMGIRVGGTGTIIRHENKYYLSGVISNGEEWDFGTLITLNNSAIGLDIHDHGRGSGKTGSSFSWGSSHRTGTKDFAAGDKIRLKWSGGVKGTFPKNAILQVIGGSPNSITITKEMLEKIRIVPNPYIARQEAERGTSRIYFNYLPEECTIRIYTIALDLVKVITHSGGSREEWDMKTEGGQTVASQMLYAYIQSPNGKNVIKKFSLVMGR
jgi:hypothetical protein